MAIKRMTDLDLRGKRVLIREDLNVPLKDGEVADDTRIRASLPTIRHAMEAGAKVMLFSHLGRPTEGEYSEENSTKPVARHLSKLLGKEVPVIKDWLDAASASTTATWCCSKTCASPRARRRTSTKPRRNTPPCATCM